MLLFMTSFASDLFADKNTIVDMKNPDMHVEKTAKHRYGASKAGDWIYGYELSKRFRAQRHHWTWCQSRKSPTTVARGLDLSEAIATQARRESMILGET